MLVGAKSTVSTPETPGLCCPRGVKPVDPVKFSSADPNWSSAMLSSTLAWSGRRADFGRITLLAMPSAIRFQRNSQGMGRACSAATRELPLSRATNDCNRLRAGLPHPTPRPEAACHFGLPDSRQLRTPAPTRDRLARCLGGKLLDAIHLAGGGNDLDQGRLSNPCASGMLHHHCPPALQHHAHRVCAAVVQQRNAGARLQFAVHGDRRRRTAGTFDVDAVGGLAEAVVDVVARPAHRQARSD